MRHTLVIVGAALVAVIAAVAIPAMAASFHSGHYTLSASSSLDVSCPNALSYATTDANDGTLSCADNPVTTTTSGSCTAGFGQSCLTAPSGYTAANLVWDDRFQGTTLDTTHWSNIKGGPLPGVGAWGNGSYGGQPIVNNGLTLNSNAMVDTDNPSTGKKLFTFPSGGFFLQVKFKVTDMTNGFWPAIWFPWDNVKTPPTGEEIDLFEGGMLGGACNTSTINACVEYNYGGQSANDPTWKQGFSNIGVNLTQQFVTLGLHYIPGQRADFYYNGSLVMSDINTIGSFKNYNLLITPQGAPCSGTGTNGWHQCGTGTGSMYISEVQVYS